MFARQREKGLASLGTILRAAASTSQEVLFMRRSLET